MGIKTSDTKISKNKHKFYIFCKYQAFGHPAFVKTPNLVASSPRAFREFNREYSVCMPRTKFSFCDDGSSIGILGSSVTSVSDS